MRVYTSDDPIGVEVGGAVKNVLAIATGIADGMGLGLNARAALITRGLAEMTRLGVALGAEAATFMGLSGLGDLVLTATGDLSRNRARRPRARAAAARSPRSSPSSATSPRACAARRWCCARAAARGVEMPIVAAVAEVLDGRIAPEHALERLMRREAARRIGSRAGPSLHVDRSGVAVLPPRLEHRHRDGVAEVQAALAGAHRQPHRCAASIAPRTAAGRPAVSPPNTSQSPGAKATSATDAACAVAS